MTKVGFSRRLGISVSNLHKMIAKSSYPTAGLAQRIVKLTNGEMTFEDLFQERN
jgi:DNA-binding transcriptional regulator YdaS (Cro superfamily)